MPGRKPKAKAKSTPARTKNPDSVVVKITAAGIGPGAYKAGQIVTMSKSKAIRHIKNRSAQLVRGDLEGFKAVATDDDIETAIG